MNLNFSYPIGIGLIAALYAQAIMGGPVTVNVTTQSGSAAADSVLVFDPLDATPPSTHDSALIDQVDKRFVPHINVLRTGTVVTFPNSDHIRHQVYSFSPAKVFTLKLYAGSPASPITFDRPGLVVLGCNIHDNMVAFVAVVDSPYFARAGAAGSGSVNLPPGHYRLRVWHPSMTAALAPQDIAVQAAPMVIPIMINLNLDAVAVAPWPE